MNLVRVSFKDKTVVINYHMDTISSWISAINFLVQLQDIC